MKQAWQDLKNTYHGSTSNEHGQAVIEYILMLVVIVSLVLAGGKMFSSLDEFIKKYMGDYIECLMAYGELPTLGVDEADLKKHKDGAGTLKTCDTRFAKFTFEAGRPGTVGGGSSSQNGGNKNSSNSADNKGGDKADSASEVARNSNRNRSSGRSSPYQTGEIRRFADAGTADGPNAARSLDSSKTKLIPGDAETETLGASRSNYYSSGLGTTRPKYKAITGKMAEELDKKNPDAKNKEPILKSVTTAEEEGYRFQPRRSTVTPPEKRDVANIQDKEISFGFGDFIKWLFVIGIIAGLVAFFGSQLLGISKSQD